MFVVIGMVGAGFGISYKSVSANDNGNNKDQSGMMGKDREDMGEHMKQAHATGSTLEVHISDNGMVLVRGAKVTAVTGNLITATTAWGGSTINWQVVAGNTRFVNRSGSDNGTMTSVITVGDFVSFSGPLNSGVSGSFSVNANTVKDWSSTMLMNAKTTLEGKVKTAPVGAVTTTLVLTVDGKDYTVKVAADISVLNSSWLRMPISSIAVGDSVRIYGTVNTDMTINATVVRDTSIK
jgi:hypothetical protein